MRLICPSCGAQYEVDASMIPDEGRDVQCSSCGNTWFQRAEGDEPELRDGLAGSRPTPETGASGDDFRDDDDLDDDDGFDAAPSSDAAPRQVSDDVLGVLREEAEHEARARAQDDDSPEDTGTDMVATPPTEEEIRAQQARERMARLRGIEPDEKDRSGSRGELLPDIDEINSTLRAESERQKEAGHLDVPPSDIERRRRGFRLGFGTSLLIVAILAAAYIYAPQIVRAVPFSEPVLVGYVGVVNDMRSLLEEGMQNTLQNLRGDEAENA